MVTAASSTGIAEASEALCRLARVVSNRTGLVCEVVTPELEEGDPRVRVALARPAAPPPGWHQAMVNEGAGASLTTERAMVKALAESVERYCAASTPDGLPFGRANEIGPVIPSEAFALFSDTQYAAEGFPFRRPDSRCPLEWVQGRRLVDGGKIYAPAAFVYLPFARRRAEPKLSTAISTGLAAGMTEESAIASGLCEVVERDAFMLIWRHRRSTERLNLGQLPMGPHTALLSALQSAGMSCVVRLITQDIPIPVFLVILTSAGGHGPLLALGAGAARNVRAALLLALEEACLSLYGIRRLMRRHAAQVLRAEHAELTTLGLQSAAYAMRRNLANEAGFLASDGGLVVTLTQLEERFAALKGESLDPLITALGQWSRYAAVVECTTADILDIGFRVVRVLIPGLQPLDHNHAYPHLGGERLGTDPLNLLPHPFP
jgi:ribosomal protein S12 methylthiotransferase accessory factor